MCPISCRLSDLFGWVDLLEMFENRLGKQRRSEVEERLEYAARTESKPQSDSKRGSVRDTETEIDLRLDQQEVTEKRDIDSKNLLEQAQKLSDLIRQSQKLSRDCMKQISTSINNGGKKLELDKLNKKNIQILSETRKLRVQLEQVQMRLSQD